MVPTVRIAAPIVKSELEKLAARFKEVGAAAMLVSTSEQTTELKQAYVALRSRAIRKVSQCFLDQHVVNDFKSTVPMVPSDASHLQERTAVREASTRAAKRLHDLCAQFE
jgi:hypothetical protein